MTVACSVAISAQDQSSQQHDDTAQDEEGPERCANSKSEDRLLRFGRLGGAMGSPRKVAISRLPLGLLVLRSAHADTVGHRISDGYGR